MSRWIFIALQLMAATASQSVAAVPRSSPLSPLSPGGNSTTLFTALPAAQTGISHINPIDTSHGLKRLYTSTLGGGGIAAGDFDGDDRCDLYFVSGARTNTLFRN